MKPDFWKNVWHEGRIAFHQSQIHTALEKYGNKFSSGTILVPLCGKTLDMLYLTSKGHKVIGVELSAIACRDFFKESKIKFTEKPTQDFTIFESEKITLWCGDFFNLPQEVWSQITGIYDRAALVALPEEMRQKYASEILNNTSNLEMLLISFEYPNALVEGPPFSVPDNEIKKLYKPFDIQNLQTDSLKLRNVDILETVYWLIRTAC